MKPKSRNRASAYILAIMDSPEIAHPRLEAVITVDEEIGMLGAEGCEGLFYVLQ